MAPRAASARVIEAKSRSPRTPKFTTVASSAKVRAKTRVASATIKTRHGAASDSSHATVAVAWEPPRSEGSAAKYAANSHAYKTRVAVSYSYKGRPAATAWGRASASPSAGPSLRDLCQRAGLHKGRRIAIAKD